MGRRPGIISTPPFMPGGRPGLDMTPSSPGVVGLLQDGIMSAAQPNVAGGGALDVLRAIAGGMGQGQQRQQSDFQRRLAVMELGRKLENDGVLAEARRAEMARDRAKAELDLHNAQKKPLTAIDKFHEAMQVPGMTAEKAMAVAFGGKLPDPVTAPPRVSITPEVAQYSGIAVPMVEQPVQVPTTDPVNDRRTVPMQVPSTAPVELPPNIAQTAMQNWGHRPSPQAQQRRMPAPTLRDTENGLVFVELNPDGTPKVTPTGLHTPDRRRPRGSSSNSEGSPMTRSRALPIESRKQQGFKKILEDIERDGNPASNVGSYVARALDVQRIYESEIGTAGGEVSAEISQRQMDAVRKAIVDRVADAVARSSATKEEPEPIPATSGMIGTFKNLFQGAPRRPSPAARQNSIKILKVE
jgi:hypothetical protein